MRLLLTMELCASFEMLVMTVALLGVALAAPHAEHRSKDDQDDEEKEEKVVVPILKQINRLNDDGSYTFGFEAGDGTFRVYDHSSLSLMPRRHFSLAFSLSFHHFFSNSLIIIHVLLSK